MSHTKGPWKADEVEVLLGEVTLYVDSGNKPRRREMKYEPAVVGGGSWSRDEIGSAELEANAALIAAAPEMLEALKSAYGLLGCHCITERCHGNCAKARIVAAIAKAEGK